MSFAADLNAVRRDLYARAGGGAALPLAGMIYWGALALLAGRVPTETWVMAAYFGSGAIFPLGIALQKPTGSDVLAKSELSGATFAGLIAMMLVWPITIAGSQGDPSFVPLSLAIGMSLHWPIVGWMYGRTVLYTSHALIRAAAVTGIWFALPDHRFDLIPAAVVGAYAISFLWILIDRPRRRVAAAAA